MMRAVLGVLVASPMLLAACSDPAPRMHVSRPRVHAGDRFVVHLEDAVQARRTGGLWLTLVPPGSPESFVGDRVAVDEGATHVAVPTAVPGRFELRLHDDFPRRAHHLVARVAVEVEPQAVARRDPPVWYW